MAFHHKATYMLPSLTFPFHFFYSISKSMSVFHWQFLITYISSGFLTFWACYIKGQWSEFKVKNVTLNLQITFWRFLLFFIKKFVFLSFSFLFFFDEVSKLRSKISTNQKPEDFVRGTVYAQSLPLDVKKWLQQIYSKYF